jgi:predicted nuclease of restriction endonuclease-like (RecB) superfamily
MTEFRETGDHAEAPAEPPRTITREIARSHYRSALTANGELIHQYWRIGRHILGHRLSDSRYDEVLARLTAEIRAEYPRARGYSRANLHRMTTFAAAWPEFVPQSMELIPWGHVVVLLDMLDDRATREFYAMKAAHEGWARSTLTMMIRSGLHLRPDHPLYDTGRTVPLEDRDCVRDMLTDPYVRELFDGGERRGRDLEARIVDAVVTFLQDLRVGFAFAARRRRLSARGEEFFADLLFYHLTLHRYVVVDLRTDGFAPEHTDRLDLCVAAVDDQVRDRMRDEPTLGVLLVASRDQIMVEYRLGAMISPLSVGPHTLPADLQAALPTPAELAGAIAPALRDDSREDDILERTITEGPAGP